MTIGEVDELVKDLLSLADVENYNDEPFQLLCDALFQFRGRHSVTASGMTLSM